MGKLPYLGILPLLFIVLSGPACAHEQTPSPQVVREMPVDGTPRVSLSLPPQSLGKWYKPQNEHQVWFYNMLTLDRAMQALGVYTALNDREHLTQWAETFNTSYRRIAEMVPEWKDELELEWADRMLSAAKAGDSEGLATAMRKVGVSCRSCHNEYQAVAAAIYRGPDFEKVTVERSETLEEIPFHEAMEGLSTAINRLGIAVQDGRFEAAAKNTAKLATRLNDLGGACQSCHDDTDPREAILGASNMAILDRLNDALTSQDGARAGKELQHFGGAVCGECHSIHRTLADLRAALLKNHQH